MAGAEPFSTSPQGGLDYFGCLNDGAAALYPRLCPPSASISTSRPQAGWTSGELDTNAPSDHYPVQAVFTLP